MYDNNGDAFGFTYNNVDYYYIKNAQNDVTAIADSSGTVIVNYYYDAYILWRCGFYMYHFI